jgi:alkylation response protein AidB-like acyl-CoA dehydrogenase
MIPRQPECVAALRRQIASLVPLVERYREAFDRERRLPQPVFEALADLDLLRLWVPKELAGPELSPLDFMEVVESTAELDGSIGWIVGNGAGMSRVAGYLPEAVAREWFGDQRTFLASATGAFGDAVRTAGGYRVSGRWPFGSGIHHARRIMGLCTISGGEGCAGSQAIACYFAPADVRIIDTWRVSGLRGTGSCDFEVRDRFVPACHTHAFPNHCATQPGLLYRLPSMSAFAWTVSVVPLGIAQAAIASFKTLVKSKARSGNPLARSERVQEALGRAETRHLAARGLLVTAMTELMAATEAGGDRLVRARASLRTACAFAAENAAQLVDSLAAQAGAASIFESCALERCVRDVHAAVKHVAMSSSAYAHLGRLVLGLEPETARF